jgi:16S rRNA (guanine527-N7)-methyltransferase
MQQTLLPLMTELWQETLGWLPNADQQELFNQFYQQILVGNQQFNLTRITEITEFWEKHLWDSLWGIKPLLALPATPRKIIDIGTGAGVPGIPISIALPDSQVVLLDSTQKKIRFLDELITKLKLPNVTTLLGRAEQINQQANHCYQYDLVTVRAVAKIDVCVKYSLPFLNANGLAILYRGNWTEEEATQLEHILPSYKAEIAEITSFTTPLTQGTRHCIYLKRN